MLQKTQHLLTFLITLLYLLDFRVVDFSLGEIDVSFLLIDSDDTADFVLVDLLSREQQLLVVLSLSLTRVLRKRDHPFCVVILQQRDND